MAFNDKDDTTGRDEPEMDNAEEFLDPPDEKNSFDITAELYDWAQALVMSLIIMVLTFTFVVRLIGVSGISMTPTLLDEDKVVLSKLFYTPKKGDVIVFTVKGLRLTFTEDYDKPLVKRIIAVAGQTVSINPDKGEVYVDGILQDEPYINERVKTAIDLQGEVVVPDGYVFVMGDNRNHSTDSRDNRIGFVDTRFILGRVLMRVFPFNDMGFID